MNFIILILATTVLILPLLRPADAAAGKVFTPHLRFLPVIRICICGETCSLLLILSIAVQIMQQVPSNINKFSEVYGHAPYSSHYLWFYFGFTVRRSSGMATSCYLYRPVDQLAGTVVGGRSRPGTGCLCFIFPGTLVGA